MMKLTRFEKWFMNSPQRARHAKRAALALFEHIKLPPQPRCLEIGCGQGAVTRLLVERFGAQAVATDFDPEQVAVAQERLADLGERVEFRVVDARAMPFDDAQFDGVFSFGVLHHILGGWRQAIAETARVLKPGGWFFFTDLVLPPRASRLVKFLLPRLDQLEETALHACLAENGLHLEHYERGRRGILAVPMGYCAAVARRA
jgi:ubiquinone/menaquinone biosynthesis C-methylase UbiE